MTHKCKKFINKNANEGENHCTITPAILLVLRSNWQRVLTALGDFVSLSAEARDSIHVYYFRLKPKDVFCKGMLARHSAMLPRDPQAASKRTITVNK